MKGILLAGLIVGSLASILAAEEPAATAKKPSRAELEQRYVELVAQQAVHLDDDQLERIVASIEEYNTEVAAHKALSQAVDRLYESLDDLKNQFPGTIAAQEADNMLKAVSIRKIPAYSGPQLSNRTLEQRLSLLIGHFSGIKDARVTLGRSGAGATVTVVPQGRAGSADQAEVIRKTIANGVPGICPEKISIMFMPQVDN